MRFYFLIFAFPAFLSMTSCLSYDLSRKTVVQGNIITPKKINQLRIGMSKKQAAEILGSSLISPVYDNDRWDYAFTKRVSNQTLIKNKLVLYFKHNQLVRIDKNLNF